MSMSKTLTTLDRKKSGPRRSTAEKRYQAAVQGLATLEQRYEEERQELLTDRAEAEADLMWFTYSVQRRELLARVDLLPASPGVYVIWASLEVLYVGESVNVRARAQQHLTEAWSFSADRDYQHPLYRDLTVQRPESITFTVYAQGDFDKQERLKHEQEAMEYYTDLGNLLYNRAAKRYREKISFRTL